MIKVGLIMEIKDIIKGLEYCAEHGMCDDCEYIKKQYDCSDYLKTDALNLIKNQQAEIEKQRKEAQILRDEIIKLQTKIEIVKTEAYKEFAELVKRRMFKGEKYDYERNYIDNLANELTERKED